MREFEKVVVLRAVDSKWMDHIDAMDQLVKVFTFVLTAVQIRLREYQFEGFEMFQEMIENIQEEVAMYIMKAHVENNLERQAVAEGQAVDPKSEACGKKPVVRAKSNVSDATIHAHAAAARNSSNATDNNVSQCRIL